MPRAQVIVVGAGIAGLTAAHTLARRGFHVRVLEASTRVGGRMTSGEIDGVVVDHGAQFLSSAYPIVLSLIRDVSLEPSVQETSRRVAVVRGGEIRRATAGRPLSLAVNGPLAWREWLRLGLGALTVTRTIRRLPVNDYSAWAELDDEDASLWCRRRFGRGATDYLVGPVVEGFYFQPLEGMSRALPLALTLLASRRPRTLTLSGGIGMLPEALAAQLDVVLDTPVEAIETTASGIGVRTVGRTFECDRVVLATTASAARRLHPDPGPLERDLMATTYSSTINVALATEPGWRPPAALRDVYGLLVPRAARSVIAAVGLESRKRRAHPDAGELLNVMVAGHVAAELLALPDEEVTRRVLDELERHLPTLHDAVRSTHCFRWPEAEPCSPLGRSRLIAAYRRSLPPTSGIVLAGDYLGMPFVEGAAETGVWSALHVAAA